MKRVKRKYISKKRVAFTVIAAVLVFSLASGFFMYFMPVAQPTNTSYETASQIGDLTTNGYICALRAPDGAELLVSKNDGAVALVSPNGETFGGSSVYAASAHLACALKLRVRDRSANTYELNSYDNSAVFGQFSFEPADSESPARLVFDFYKDSLAAQKGPNFNYGKIYVRIALNFSIENGSIKAYVDTESIVHSNGLRIESISILPGVLANGRAVGGDCFILPDGCGAKISVNGNYNDDLNLNLAMYGTDLQYGEYKDGAMLPIYAASKNKTLLNVLITDGDALSEIVFKRARTGGGYAYTRFNINPCAYLDGKVYEAKQYDGVVGERFVFSQAVNDSYNSTAAILRDYLVSKDYLRDAVGDSVSDMPFYVTVVGSRTGELGDDLTTYDDAAEIIALLKSKGVRGLALRFEGGVSGGLDQNGNASLGLLDALGGKDAFSRLNSSAKKNNSSVWLDLNLLTDDGENKSMPFKTDVYSLTHNAIATDGVKKSLCDRASIEQNISNAFEFTCNIPSANYCINDMSYLLYSDASSNLNRQDALEIARDKVDALAVNGNIMLAKPSLYLLSKASAVSEIPQNCSCEGADGVSAVPLMQMTVHGKLSYGSTPVNLYDNTNVALLKAVEYGACASFIFTHSDCNGLEYGKHASQTAQYFNRLKQMASVSDMTMTSHEEITQGVFKVTYDYSKTVYVNYNPSVVSVDGIYINAGDFVVI